jgi:hypothetical protein
MRDVLTFTQMPVPLAVKNQQPYGTGALSEY